MPWGGYDPPKHVTGVEQTIRAIGKARVQDAINMEEGLLRCAWAILARSDYYVPVATGNLENSGRVESNGKKGFGAQFTVVYGVTDAALVGTTEAVEDAFYALYVHEDLTKYHDPPTSAKFLEKGTRETRSIRGRIMRRQMVETGSAHFDGVKEKRSTYKSPAPKKKKP